MSEDLREDMKKLKDEIASLKDQLKDIAEGGRKKRGFYIDMGNSVQDYVDDVMQGVAEGVHGELDRSIFIGPGGCRIWRRGHHPESEEARGDVDFKQMAGTMNALGHEHRLKILSVLMGGGKYINELQEELSEITTSTLSSHLDVLEKVGLVVQEKIRGRYLITMPGRTAYKMAEKITVFLEGGRPE